MYIAENIVVREARKVKDKAFLFSLSQHLGLRSRSVSILLFLQAKPAKTANISLCERRRREECGEWDKEA
jgi:hypothetical protein